MVTTRSLELYLTSIYVFVISFILGLILLGMEDWTEGRGTQYFNLNLEFAAYLAVIATGAYTILSQNDLYF